MAEISPSILAADYSKIFEIVQKLEGRAKSIHVDVMDNKFVPNYTLDRFNPEFMRKLDGISVTKNVHLMVEDNLHWTKEFCKAGSDEIAFHVEAGKTVECIELVRDYGIKAGLAIKPKTQPKEIEHFLPRLDFVLVMSVEPGFAGQKFMPNALSKLKWLREHYVEAHGGKVWVDGGVTAENARQCAEAGASVLVAAKAVFSVGGDFLENLSGLQRKIGEKT
ncbi:MAG: ribulose-phosphate 3-epimerase [Candidatus Norongarragalinales archaeon]